MQVKLNLSNPNQFKNNNVNTNKNNSPAFTSKVQFLEGATKGTEDFLVYLACFKKREAKNCVTRFKESLENLTNKNKIGGTIKFRTDSPYMAFMNLSYITEEGKELLRKRNCNDEISIMPDLSNYKNPFEKPLNKSIDILSQTLKENGYADHENPFLQLQQELIKGE